MTCDICKGEHQTWECPDARQAALDTFEALDIPSLRDGYMPVETAYLAALKHIEELWADNARLSDSLATCEMDARDQADKIRTIKAANANYQAVHREQILRIAELEEERDMLRNALARIRDYNPPDEMSHKAWRVRINVMRTWAWKALARKGRKDVRDE